MKRATLLAAMIAALSLTSCNIFDPLDSPSDDDQIRSAARACVDKGDFACAREWYGKLSSQTDRDRAEQAYIALDEAGLSMATFISAFGSGGNTAGAIITTLAGSLTAHANPTNRLKIFNAYKISGQMAPGEEKGLLRFIAGIGLASAILAEEADIAGKLRKADYVQDPTTCPTVLASCAPPVGAKIGNGGSFPGDLDSAVEADISAPLTIGMIKACFIDIQEGLTDMGIGSSSNNALLNFTSQAGPLADDFLRQFLLSSQVGE